MGRPDGTRLKKIPKFRDLEFYLMNGRNESVIYYNMKLDLTKTLAYLDKINAGSDKKKLTLFHIILCAAVRTIAHRPQVNRFIMNKRLYQRNEIVFSFVVKKALTEEAKETNAKIPFSPFETLETIVPTIENHLARARSEEGNENDKEIESIATFPRFFKKFLFKAFRWLDKWNLAPKGMIKTDPLYSSVFLANLGSVKLDAVTHHLFEWGTIAFFLVIGKIHKDWVIDQTTGEASVKDICNMHISLDDRISEGIYLGKTVDLLKELIENPERLETPPDLSKEDLEELMLKDFKP